MRASQHAVARQPVWAICQLMDWPSHSLDTTARPRMPPHCLPQIFPGFAGAKVMYGPGGEVHGVQVCTQAAACARHFGAARCSCCVAGAADGRAVSHCIAVLFDINLLPPPGCRRPTTLGWARMGGARTASSWAWRSRVGRWRVEQ